MVLGNMDVGLNTQNLMAILMVVALSIINIFGVKLGAAIQNVFTSAKSRLCSDSQSGIFIGRNAQALAANFNGHFWSNAALSAQHAVQVGVGGPTVLVGAVRFSLSRRSGLYFPPTPGTT